MMMMMMMIMMNAGGGIYGPPSVGRRPAFVQIPPSKAVKKHRRSLKKKNRLSNPGVFGLALPIIVVHAPIQQKIQMIFKNNLQPRPPDDAFRGIQRCPFLKKLYLLGTPYRCTHHVLKAPICYTNWPPSRRADQKNLDIAVLRSTKSTGFVT